VGIAAHGRRPEIRIISDEDWNAAQARWREIEGVKEQFAHVPEELRLRKVELNRAQTRVHNFIELIASGRATPALADASAKPGLRPHDGPIRKCSSTTTRLQREVRWRAALRIPDGDHLDHAGIFLDEEVDVVSRLRHQTAPDDTPREDCVPLSRFGRSSAQASD
jgi:hypothetical protein